MSNRWKADEHEVATLRVRPLRLPHFKERRTYENPADGAGQRHRDGHPWHLLLLVRKQILPLVQVLVFEFTFNAEFFFCN